MPSPKQARLVYRNLLIAAGHRFGMTARQIADALELTPARVHAILQDLGDSLDSNSERSDFLHPHIPPTLPPIEPFK